MQEGSWSCSSPLSPLGLVGRNFPGPLPGDRRQLDTWGSPLAPPDPRRRAGPELPSAAFQPAGAGSDGRRGRCGCSSRRTTGAFTPGWVLASAAGRTDPGGWSPATLWVCPCWVCVSLLGWTSSPGPAGACLRRVASPQPPTLRGCCCCCCPGFAFAFSFPAPGLATAALGQAAATLPRARCSPSPSLSLLGGLVCGCA